MTTVTVTCDVDVDIDEAFSELSKDQQRAFLARCQSTSSNPVGDTIRTACAMIRRGDALDAARFLEAEFFPKWQTAGECLAALVKSQKEKS